MTDLDPYLSMKNRILQMGAGEQSLEGNKQFPDSHYKDCVWFEKKQQRTLFFYVWWFNKKIITENKNLYILIFSFYMDELK